MSSVEPIGSRQTGELARLLEERGIGREDFQYLNQHPDQVVQLIRTKGGTVAARSFQHDMRKEEWELLEDVERKINSATSLEAVRFLKKGEEYIDGEELVLRASGELRANYGQHDAEWLFEHQEEIPEELQEFYLVFTGTIWRDSNGYRYVAYLHWSGRRWYLDFDWLGCSFGGNGRLVRVRE